MEGTIDMAMDKDMLDELLAGRDPRDLFAKDRLLDELKEALCERMLSEVVPPSWTVWRLS
jgi:putative transposase